MTWSCVHHRAPQWFLRLTRVSPRSPDPHHVPVNQPGPVPAPARGQDRQDVPVRDITLPVGRHCLLCVSMTCCRSRLCRCCGARDWWHSGGKICLSIHFMPLWARNAPRFGIAHALALGVRRLHAVGLCALGMLGCRGLTDCRLHAFATTTHAVARSLLRGSPQRYRTWLMRGWSPRLTSSSAV